MIETLIMDDDGQLRWVSGKYQGFVWRLVNDDEDREENAAVAWTDSGLV